MKDQSKRTPKSEHDARLAEIERNHLAIMAELETIRELLQGRGLSKSLEAMLADTHEPFRAPSRNQGIEKKGEKLNEVQKVR